MKTRFSMAFSIVLVMAILLSTIFVFAHAMFIETVEEGKVQVLFDDGTPNQHAEVIVYDEAENEIARGEVDREGYYSYAEEEAAVLVAEDTFGHRAEYVVGVGMRHSLPRVPTVSAVLVIFVLIAALFHYRVKKRRKLEE